MRFATVLAAALLLCGLPASAEEETPRARLLRALDLENFPPTDHEAALTIYVTVTELPDLPADIRADALAGAARCHLHFDRHEQARAYLQRIVEDETLREKARSWARGELDKHEPVENGPGGAATSSADFEEHLAREQAKRRRDAQELLRHARTAFQARRYKEARSLCLEALSKDYENVEAKTLLEDILSTRPERGDLLRRLIHFLQTAQLEEYQRLKSSVDDLLQRGKRAADKKEYPEADRLFREALRLIDESDFLTAGGALDIETLATLRVQILTRLQVVHEHGSAAGLTFAPEPPVPNVARTGGLQKEFYALLARIFSPHERSKEPMRFYDFAPATQRDAEAKRLVSSSFLGGLQASHRTGTLTRARWAERWIRKNIGARWSDPSAQRGRGRSAARKDARILTRFGSLICAQHREIEHGRIRKLLTGFAKASPPLTIKVHAFAAGPGAAVRAAEALRVMAPAGDAGMAVIDRTRVIENCLRALEGLQNLKSLGGATIQLDGEAAVTLALTRLTQEHPLYLETAAPTITIPDELARYGLWLDLFGEVMPNATGDTKDHGALSVRARVLQPNDAQHSHVVPRRGSSNASWTRLPLMTEQVREADAELPDYGTLALFGLANPFPGSRQDHGELLILIGLRPRGAPTPEAPRTAPNPRIVPAGDTVKDYALGPLSTEVPDRVVAEDWPELHTVAEGSSASDRRRGRDHYLSWLLGQMAGVDNAGSPDVRPIVVRQGLATANLSDEEHVRLQKAIERLRSCENHLYVVRVESAVMPRKRWNEWKAREGITTASSGSLRAEGTLREALEQELATLRESEHLFNTAPVSILARSTQRVLQTSTRSRDITKDLRVRLLDRGRQRYTAMPGKAEEGLVVEVRPGIEQLQGAMRRIKVRMRAARLKTIESRAYPRANQPAARYDVPLWHEVSKRSFVDVADVEILDDRTALYMPLQLPGAPNDVIVVSVAVARAQ